MKHKKLAGLALSFVLSVSMSVTALVAPAVTDEATNTEPYERTVANAAGEDVLLAQTGTKLAAIGKIAIEPTTGNIRAELVEDYIDVSIPSSVILDDTGAFVRVGGAYRVTDVMVGKEPLDLNKTYTVASHNYMIKESGSGFNMFQGNALIQDCTMLDNQLLIGYITDCLGGSIGSGYENPYGDGRIQVINSAEELAA